MNRLTVIQTSQGIAQYLLDQSDGPQDLSVVIGYDGRRDSRRFAELAATAFDTKGLRVIWYEHLVHTPMVPFGVKTRKATAGVMITASHNPKEDNGYKVYGSNGCQINAPMDKAISESIMQNLEPMAWETKPESFETGELYPIVEQYFAAICQVVSLKSPPPPVAYTPLHGVGLPYMLGAIRYAMTGSPAGTPKDMMGCSEDEAWTELGVKVVGRQALADPSFPTVRFPNPEEDSALDLALAEAEKTGTPLVIANDPDADRFAAAQKVGNRWHQFKGDEVGALLGYYVHQKCLLSQGKRDTLMLTSAVSSQMLAAIGAAEGFEVEETLTGFKWIGNRAFQEYERAVFGYEEALGYMIADVVHDKDGIAAALLFLEACASWAAWGRTPFEVLQGLYEKYGYFETANTYWKSPDVALTQATFDHIQSDQSTLSRFFARSIKTRVRDLKSGTDTGRPDLRATLPSSPENLMITFWFWNDPALQEGVRCTIRASGTEPKIKGKWAKLFGADETMTLMLF